MNKITKNKLIHAGFIYEDLGDDSPYEVWVKNDVRIWNFNNKYWIVDALDQAGINVEFITMEELSGFFIGCKLEGLL